MKRLDIAIFVCIICAIMPTLVLVLQSNHVDNLETKLKLTEAKLESAQSERDAFEQWLKDEAETIDELKDRLDENGIVYDDIPIDTYDDAIDIIKSYEPSGSSEEGPRSTSAPNSSVPNAEAREEAQHAQPAGPSKVSNQADTE